MMDEASVLSFGSATLDKDDREIRPGHLELGTFPAHERNILTSSGSTKRARQGPAEAVKHQKRVEKLRQKLDEIINAILQGSAIGYSFAAVTKDVSALSTYKHSEQARLSDILFKQMDNYFASVVVGRLETELEVSRRNLSAESFLKEFEIWESKLLHLSKLFMFLDRVYLLQHPKKKTIQEHGLNRFAEHFLDEKNSSSSCPKMLKDFVGSLHLACIRSGKDNYNELLRLIRIVYRIDTHDEYAINTELPSIMLRNYNACRDDWWETPQTFVKTVFDNLRKDISLLTSVGRKDRAASFARMTLHSLIVSDLSEVLSSCMADLVEVRPPDELGILTKFVKTAEDMMGVDYNKEIVHHFGAHVNLVTRQLLEESQVSGKNPLVSVIKLWRRFVDFCDDLKYDSGVDFRYEVRQSMSKAISSPELQSYSIQTFSKYCDSCFKQKDLDREAFKANALTFFRFVDNKTRLLLQYERDLSKRLLLGKQFNLSLEVFITNALLSVVGESVNGVHLREMIEEVQRCDEKYKLVSSGTAFSPLVLKKSNWPDLPGQATNLKMPGHLQEILDSFTEQFRNSDGKSQYKLLDWSNYLLHQLTLSVTFEKGVKDLQVNLLQATVILVFSERDSVSVEELGSATGIGEKLLKRVVNSLISSRYPLLLEKDGMYTFNYGFWDAASKIRLPMAREKESVVVDALKKAERRSRNEEIKASVVRLLKENTTMLYPELIGQSLIKLRPRGEVALSTIKKVIEQLITQEFIKRSEDGQTLVYIP